MYFASKSESHNKLISSGPFHALKKCSCCGFNTASKRMKSVPYRGLHGILLSIYPGVGTIRTVEEQWLVGKCPKAHWNFKG